MKRDNFESNISQLLNLLKKILKSHPEGSQLSHIFDHQNVDKINLNLCFFNFIPMTPEELDELEAAYADAAEESDSEDASGSEHANDFTWNQADLDFLRRNGIKL